MLLDPWTTRPDPLGTMQPVKSRRKGSQSSSSVFPSLDPRRGQRRELIIHPSRGTKGSIKRRKFGGTGPA